MSDKEENDINLKVEELNEVLSNPPSWLIRWGITLIFVSLILLFAFSHFIKYPDKLTGSAIITSINPPVRLLAKTTGKIALILAKNNDEVKPNSVVAVIENTANYKDVWLMDSITTLLTSIKYAQLPIVHFDKYDNLKLGDLTTQYSLFEKSYRDYLQYLETTPQIKEIAIIDRELLEYEELVQKYTTQEKLFGEEYALIEKDFGRISSLHDNKVIPDKEFDDKKRELLQAKRNYESLKITTGNTKITINNLEKNKLQLQQQQTEQQNRFVISYNESLKALRNSIELWKKQYLIQAPTYGKAVFSSVWTVNQNVNANDEIVSIVSSNEQKIICKLTIPAANTGKMKLNQKVHIQLNDYPYQEYGYLIGNITSIPAVSNKTDVLIIDVEIPDQLMTNYHKKLAYKEEMKGIAYIITEDMSLLERFFYQTRKLLDKV